ncbi:GNAT family N-acetyltransferase [Halorarum salinum]|uniref:GNAT family N-acetyltransferase n=1 Tax=Halorarum salinum TaxID=2743089 RepID=A0A7D5L8W0_9EURY|nr:GNAT family N-acetyltransferase [Halobaculum salinum]QLG60953.1 GNAT family N-acetyltransferase [Halobaculum salinum]
MASTLDGAVIRPYRPADRDRFLSLYERVWGRRKGVDWFEWRFERNPYADGVEMVVAERDGRLVGAEPLLPLRLRVDDAELRAHQPVDWIVDPDHRRQGLFTRMTERLLDRYAESADLLFNFPSDQLLPGLEKFDWRRVGPVPQVYRVQNPPALLAHKAGGTVRPGGSLLARLSAPAVDGWLRALDALDRGTGGVEVERHDAVPVADLVALAAEGRPDAVHVARDAAFYGWRFGNPRWETTTYLARRAGDPVAAVVAATERVDGVDCTSLLDVQPMDGRRDRAGAVAALLRAVVADGREADVLKAVAGPYARPLSRRGFRRDDGFPLSRVATRTTQVVRPLSADGEPDWTCRGRDLTDPDNWRLALADLDVE